MYWLGSGSNGVTLKKDDIAQFWDDSSSYAALKTFES
eukprot:CAMPEP_0204821468 /NCGR_PEP_ID=MMETSP1018-20131115/20484_1 /ASSEMBLY_ACC=CAM_ASM_000518 /TAXON_ID=46462 /ORGANISM="Anophryoides haemophila, Strain AH6" /LENGTH=36 /DNA_ID= /DNA_START= /DNA_END= /DNA_ORIENTATION=